MSQSGGFESMLGGLLHHSFKIRRGFLKDASTILLGFCGDSLRNPSGIQKECEGIPFGILRKAVRLPEGVFEESMKGFV